MARVIRGLSDEALIERVQQATLLYFTDFAHPVSGMARERSAGALGYDVADTVAAGGTGFGIMALIVAAERGWRPHAQIAEHVGRIVDFLGRCDRFHGVWPHFLDGATGRRIEVFAGDDGGDLVETAFLAMGLLCAAEHMRRSEPDLSAAIVALTDGIDWAAHLRPSDGALMWSRPADRPWPATALPIRGWNEALVAFVLGAGSPDGAGVVAAYHRHWSRAPTFLNGRRYAGVRLPLGPDWGGPLFLSQYSFLGLDPRGLRDRYADYGAQCRAHALANRAHCIANPNGWRGYGPDCWGLTASDDPSGYVAHHPLQDTGVITPTAALGSLPFTPAESMRALRHFHDDLGERIWGDAGFADAFSMTIDWTAESRLAIDQGPVVVALENHRSALLWRLFMARPEVRRGLRALGFEVGPPPRAG
ncbi:MAG: glucoamylase family protein [Rubrimonas sp.]